MQSQYLCLLINHPPPKPTKQKNTRKKKNNWSWSAVQQIPICLPLISMALKPRPVGGTTAWWLLQSGRMQDLHTSSGHHLCINKDLFGQSKQMILTWTFWRLSIFPHRLFFLTKAFNHLPNHWFPELEDWRTAPLIACSSLVLPSNTEYSWFNRYIFLPATHINLWFTGSTHRRQNEYSD